MTGTESERNAATRHMATRDAANRHEANRHAANRHAATILLVDDKPANIKLLFDALEGTGYRTLVALDGESAVHQAKLAGPDLVLMDVMMPGIDGFEACRRLKADPATGQIPVIFMTALTDTSDKIKGFKAGGVDYLTKPLQHDEVLARIDAHLSRHRFWADVDNYGKILLEMGAAESLDDAWTALAGPTGMAGVAGPTGMAGVAGSTGIAGVAGMHNDLAGLALWLASKDELVLRHAEGFSHIDPSSWRHPGGTYARVPTTDPLLGPVFTEQRQVSAADEVEWNPFPPGAKAERIQAYIVSPVCCQDACFGVLGAFFKSPVRFAFTERKRWQHILARSLGNAVFQSRSREAIRRLSEQLKQENAGLKAEVSGAALPGGIVSADGGLRRVLEQADLVAPTDAAVLILGESGTGKELLAQRLHEGSGRRNEPIIRVNCAAIPGDLFESEFFGHVKGSFSGAFKDRVGRFELAHGGTLFLDEVAEIPIELQGKLLRVLQEGTFERIGDGKTRKVDVRLIAATNQDLQTAAEEGRFRQDLYYRLSVFPIIMPPLRERREDIAPLARHFAALSARKFGLAVPEITGEMVASLQAYEWPGNVRELRNEIERAMILARSGPFRLTLPAQASAGKATRSGVPDRVIREEEWATMQRDNLLRALQNSAWRVDGPGGAAELVGLRPTTLRSRMKAMKISRPV